MPRQVAGSEAPENVHGLGFALSAFLYNNINSLFEALSETLIEALMKRRPFKQAI
jgi:hypothetical protein